MGCSSDAQERMSIICDDSDHQIMMIMNHIELCSITPPSETEAPLYLKQSLYFDIKIITVQEDQDHHMIHLELICIQCIWRRWNMQGLIRFHHGQDIMHCMDMMVS